MIFALLLHSCLGCGGHGNCHGGFAPAVAGPHLHADHPHAQACGHLHSARNGAADDGGTHGDSGPHGDSGIAVGDPAVCHHGVADSLPRPTVPCRHAELGCSFLTTPASRQFVDEAWLPAAGYLAATCWQAAHPTNPTSTGSVASPPSLLVGLDRQSGRAAIGCWLI